MVVADTVCVSAALVSACILTGTWPIDPVSWPWLIVPAAAVSAVPVFWAFGLYRAIVRFMRSRAILSVVAGVTASLLPILIISLSLPKAAVSPSALLVYWAFAILYVGGSRFVARDFLHRRPRAVENVVIYGAGEAGANLATLMATGEESTPVAFLDDSRALQGSVVCGLTVFSPSELPVLLQEFGATRVLLAMPSTSRRRRRMVLRRLERYPVHVQTVPDINDLLSGRARLEELQEIQVEDLLGRDSVPPKAELMKGCITGRPVMVTGAGGSIGSELCRQIIRQQPRRLVLVDAAEPALYSIDREMRELVDAKGLVTEVVPILSSVIDKSVIARAIAAFGIKTLYHAAAYKHVPLVEYNMVAGARNNIFGTLRTAEAAAENGVGTFVLVSTDKAVNPTNVMGATKRLSEMCLQAMQGRGEKMRICMVRFGNVLASSGSVVPLFREQIRNGGPVTVTHRDVERYFMTIPEAAQLVIQAGAMAEGGDIFLLDMGQRVKIDNLARKMIHLMGLEVRDDQNPDGDVEIHYTGLRPAEKLYEELLISGNATGTEHPRIWRAQEATVDWEYMRRVLVELEAVIASFDCEQLRAVLQRTVREYSPPGGLADKVWEVMGPKDAAAGGSVVELPGVRTPAPHRSAE